MGAQGGLTGIGLTWQDRAMSFGKAVSVAVEPAAQPRMVRRVRTRPALALDGDLPSGTDS